MTLRETGSGLAAGAPVARHYGAMLGGHGLGVAGAFLASVVVARSLGADGRGVVALLVTATFLVGSVLTSGLEGALALEAGRRGMARASRIANTWTLGFGIVVGGGWGLAGYLGSDFWRLGAGTAAVLAAAGCVAVMAMSLERGVLLGGSRFTWVGAGRSVFGLVAVLGTGLLALLGELTPESAIAVNVLAVTAQSAVHWVVAGSLLRPVVDLSAMRSQVRYAAKAQAGVVFHMVAYRYDLLLVGAFLTAADTGIYAVVLSLAEVALIAVDAAAQMVLGSAAGGSHTIGAAAAVTRLVLVLAAAEALALAALGPLVLPGVFGEEFADGYLALVTMLPGIVAWAVWRFATSDAAGRDRPEIQSISASIGAIVAVGLGVLLIPRLGITGAALATSLGYGVIAALGVRGYSRAFGVPIGSLLIPRRADVATARSLLRRRT